LPSHCHCSRTSSSPPICSERSKIIISGFSDQRSGTEAFGFEADVENNGAIDQYDAKLKLSISDQGTSEVLFEDSITYAEIYADSFVWDVGF